MAGWQRNLQLAIRQVGRRVKNSNISTANYSSTRNLESPFSQGQLFFLWIGENDLSLPLLMSLAHLGLENVKSFLNL